MKRLLLAWLAAFAFITAPAAQTFPGKYWASPPTLIDGQGTSPLTDVNGRLVVSPTGSSASGAADSGNPTKIGCVNNTTLPTVTNGQRVDCQADVRGGIIVTLKSNGGTAAPLIAAPSDALSNSSATGLSVLGMNSWYNGSTWDREFTCPLSASISVTAGSTTQIVGLVASQIIRVCSFNVTASATGTFSFVYGTGTNCGTGQVAITGAMAVAGNSFNAMSAGNGSLFRSASANAICLAAVTGNMTGFLTYAQY